MVSLMECISHLMTNIIGMIRTVMTINTEIIGTYHHITTIIHGKGLQLKIRGRNLQRKRVGTWISKFRNEENNQLVNEMPSILKKNNLNPYISSNHVDKTSKH